MFSRLTQDDKLAFFDLLDEYFESRPHLLSQGASSGNPGLAQPAVAAAATSAVHRAMATNPKATADLISTGMKHIPKNSQYGAASNPAVADATARFAASSIASSYGTNTSNQPKIPPAPPRRVGGSEETSSSERPTPSGLAGLGGLISSKRFGDVDTSSMKSAIASSFRGGKPAPAAPSTVLPAAITAPKRNFAPPPIRRTATHASSEGDTGESADPVHEDLAPLRRMPVDRGMQQQRDTPEPQVVRGERAEAIYDYNSTADEDINVRQGDKLIIAERTSDDWWTAEMDGRRGLLPASYVRIL